MADDVEMTPVDGAEPPKASPLPGLSAPKPPQPATLKLSPVARPTPGASLKPGLKLPAQGALKPGLKLPTQGALKPGLKLPAKPVIRKPGASTASLPKPPALAKPAAPVAAPVAAKPVSVDAQGVGRLPTVAAAALGRDLPTPDIKEAPKPMEQLKSATQKLKGLTQEIPQQALLHKTGIIAADAASEAQKEAAKHKTARISLSDAMGVAPVKDDAAPMKTIRIRRPIDIPAAAPAVPSASPSTVPPADKTPVAPVVAAPKAASAATLTQRKTIKVARPGGLAVQPSGKFGVKRPAAPAEKPAAEAASAEAPVADIPDIANLPPVPPMPVAAPVAEAASWVVTLSTLVQFAACAAIGVLAWFLYQNAQTLYF